jgi:hypothetical protein
MSTQRKIPLLMTGAHEWRQKKFPTEHDDDDFGGSADGHLPIVFMLLHAFSTTDRYS